VLELILIGIVVYYTTLKFFRLSHRKHIVSAKLGTVALTTIIGVVTSPGIEPGIVAHENEHHGRKHVWQILWLDVYTTTFLVMYTVNMNWYGVATTYILGCIAVILLRAVQEVQADKAALSVVYEYPEQLEYYMRKVGAWKQPTWRHLVQGYMPPAYRIGWLKKLREGAS